MITPIVVVVFWCSLTTPIDSFNPHQINAVQKFVAEHRATCHSEQTQMLYEPDLTVEGCRARQMVAYMPGWLQKETTVKLEDGRLVQREGKLYMGANCIAYHEDRLDPLNLQALKEKVLP